jgi:hypothetical protein
MTPERFTLIRRNIARVLKDCSGFLYPEAALFTETNFQLRPRPAATLAEFEHVIARMELARHILRHNAGDEGVKVKLTELGEAEFPQ